MGDIHYILHTLGDTCYIFHNTWQDKLTYFAVKMTLLAKYFRNCHSSAISLANFKITYRCFSCTSCRKQSLAPLNYINGERAYPSGLNSFDLQEPATGRLLGMVNCSGHEDVEKSVLAAGNAFEKWSALSGVERGKVLRRAADIVRQRHDEIAKWDSVDTGGYDGTNLPRVGIKYQTGCRL